VEVDIKVGGKASQERRQRVKHLNCIGEIGIIFKTCGIGKKDTGGEEQMRKPADPKAHIPGPERDVIS